LSWNVAGRRYKQEVRTLATFDRARLRHVGCITYVGHATVLVELDGTRVLTDPVLRDRIAYILRIAPPPPPETVEDLDAVVISHAHHDHLDMPSLRRIPREVPVIAPPGCAPLVRKSGHELIEVTAGTSVRVGSVEVRAIPADHEGRRLPTDRPLPTVGYVIGSRVSFYGDTDVFDAMGTQADGLDVALLPIWGWGPKVGPGHMDPERAARAAALMRPRIAVPIHWGTLARPGVWWRNDPALPTRRFTELVAQQAPEVAVRVLAPGDRLAL
jgi:L-ascorbate metabolism protein UlaG (beta-lactamase superfamily)